MLKGLKKLINWYGLLSPRYRLAIKTVVIAIITYVAKDLSDGDIDDWESIYIAAKVSIGYAVIGLLTPIEPFVGVNKPDVVKVPSPPAEPE